MAQAMSDSQAERAMDELGDEESDGASSPLNPHAEFLGQPEARLRATATASGAAVAAAVPPLEPVRSSSLGLSAGTGSMRIGSQSTTDTDAAAAAAAAAAGGVPLQRSGGSEATLAGADAGDPAARAARATQLRMQALQHGNTKEIKNDAINYFLDKAGPENAQKNVKVEIHALLERAKSRTTGFVTGNRKKVGEWMKRWKPAVEEEQEE